MKKIIKIIYFFLAINIFSLNNNTKIVIFCYHRFDIKDSKYSIKKNLFKNHIEKAINKGFNLISEKELFDFYYNDYKLPPLNLFITIDDGFKELSQVCSDILKEYKAKPVILLNPEMIGNKEFLLWKNIIKLYKKGISFGNHSGTHFNYHNFLNKKENIIYNLLKKEIIDSDDLIEKNIGSYSISYSHPYGIFDTKIMEVVQGKYKLVYTTNKGPNVFETNPLYLRRYVIDIYSDIDKYLDYELLPIVETIPENGGYLNKNKEVFFYFESEKELKRFKDFYFLIGKKRIKAFIDKTSVYTKLDNTKDKTFTISLIATDNYDETYIETITINNL